MPTPRSTSPLTSTPPSPSTTSTPKPPIQIRLPTPTETHNPLFLHHTTSLINAAYSAPSTTLLKPHNPRTNTTEVQTWLESGNFYLAFTLPPNNDNTTSHSPPQQEDPVPVGTIRLTPLSPEISEIGILTVDPDFRSSGLGRELIAFAEGLAVGDGVGRVRIEVPAPRTDAQGQVVVSSAKKKYLRAWYEGLGYEFVGKRTLGESVPGLVRAFEEEVEILVLEKGLLGAVEIK
ncbi:hypothetical protein Q7P36_003762 [Cladosporium allicinum]